MKKYYDKSCNFDYDCNRENNEYGLNNKYSEISKKNYDEWRKSTNYRYSKVEDGCKKEGEKNDNSSYYHINYGSLYEECNETYNETDSNSSIESCPNSCDSLCKDFSEQSYSEPCYQHTSNSCDSSSDYGDSDCNNYSQKECGTSKQHNCDFYKKIIHVYSTEETEFTLEAIDCEIRLDFDVDVVEVLVIEGQVKNDFDLPCENVLVTLLKPVYLRGNIEYIKECCTLTNSVGQYQFQLPYCEKDTSYKVLLGVQCN